MKIIESVMASPEMDRICDAGVELVQELMRILQERGIGQQHASAVLAVATAGINVAIRACGENISPADQVDAIESVTSMWRADQSGIVFDPPHRQEGFVPTARDASKEN